MQQVGKKAVQAEHVCDGRQCKLARKDRASLASVLRLVDYWMTHALSVRMGSAANDLITALRPADLPDFEVGELESEH